MKFLEVLALLLFAALAPDINAVAQPASPTFAGSAKADEGRPVTNLLVASLNARDLYSANGERIGELSEILLDDAHRPVAASIETDEGTGKEHIVGAEKLRLKGARLVTNLTRQQVQAMPLVND